MSAPAWRRLVLVAAAAAGASGCAPPLIGMYQDCAHAPKCCNPPASCRDLGTHWQCDLVGSPIVPSTPAPETRAPATPAPETLAPPTVATPTPDTRAPPTAAPDTRVPPSPAPETSAPPSPAPETRVPPSPVPETSAPPSPAPDTRVPPSPAPKTSAPPSPAPDTRVPPSPVPETSAPPSPAPDTRVPPSPVPETSAPPSPAPDTRVPPSLVPETSAPPSPAPETSAPAPTAVPDTRVSRAPETSTPPTPAPNTVMPPPTPAPNTVMPAPVIPPPPAVSSAAPATPAPASVPPGLATTAPAYTHLEVPFAQNTPPPLKRAAPPGLPGWGDTALRDAGGGAVAVSLLGGSGGAMQAGRLALARSLGCSVDDVDLGFDAPLDTEFHPTGVVVGSDKARYLRGAVVMNHLVVAAFAAVCVAAAWTVHCVRRRGGGDDSLVCAFAAVKFPGVLIIPAMVLWPGTALAGAQLMFFPSVTGGWAALGAFVLLSSAAALAVIYITVIRRVPMMAEAVIDSRLYPTLGDSDSSILTGWRRSLYKFAFGDTIWVSRGGGSFADQYEALFNAYRAGCAWVLLLQVGVNLALAVLSAWKPPPGTWCTLRNTIISVLFGTYFGIVAALRPFAAPLDWIAELFLAGLTAVAFALMTVAIALGAGDGAAAFALAGACLLASAVVMAAKAIWDIGAYIADVVLERRAGARRRVRDLWASKDVSLCSLQPLQPPAAACPPGPLPALPLSPNASAHLALSAPPLSPLQLTPPAVATLDTRSHPRSVTFSPFDQALGDIIRRGRPVRRIAGVVLNSRDLVHPRVTPPPTPRRPGSPSLHLRI